MKNISYSMIKIYSCLLKNEFKKDIYFFDAMLQMDL